MSAMALGASDVVTPMLAPAEVVVVLLSCVTSQARLGSSLRIHALERNYLRLVAAALDVCFTGTVT